MIELIDSSRRNEVVDLLYYAFDDYPVMKYVVGEDPDYEAKTKKLIGFYTDKRFQNGWPVYGILQNDELIAVALVSLPSSGKTNISQRLKLDLHDDIGTDAFQREEKFEAAADQGVPDGNFYYIGMLGTHPDHQRRGFGKGLVSHVKDLARADGSDGVCLSTEDPSNVPYYIGQGFEIVLENQVDSLTNWCFVWWAQ